MSDIYRGRAPKEDYDKLLEMLNNVFFLDDDETPKRDFLTLLPKLYKKEYDPCYANFIAEVDGKIKGAVGLYPVECVAGGLKLSIQGIGNVAVARDSRREGYMIDCLKMALDAAMEEGADLSMLGGDRHRYGYFGFEPMGVSYGFRLRDRDLKHKAPKGEIKCEVHPLTPEDREIFVKINEVFASMPFSPVRPLDSFYDIMCSWNCTPYYVTENGELIGWFTVGRDGSGVGEFKPVKADDWYKLLAKVMEITGGDSFRVSAPAFDTELVSVLEQVSGGVDVNHAEHFNVFNFERVIQAFLNVKASMEELAQGSIVMLIHGVKKDERLKITVSENKPVVEAVGDDVPADIELEHREAQRLIGSLVSVKRASLPAAPRSWFPLPMYFYGTDGV